MFTIGPTKVTKEILLQANSEEAYMAFYTGINPTTDLFCSPLRADTKPTASFYRSRKTKELVLKDFGGDGFHGNFISVVMHLFNADYQKALNIIGNDFGIIKKENYTVNTPKVAYEGKTMEEDEATRIQCELKDFTSKELEWWAKFGISEKTLKKFKVFSIKHVFINGHLQSSSSVTHPIYGYFFGIKDGIEQWKIYFPTKKLYRFLLNTNAVQGWKQLPAECDHVVVTKSMKDVMTLYELGVHAIAPQAESVVLSDRHVTALKKRTHSIITNGDYDRAGINFMLKSRRKYKTVCLSFRNKTVYGKDISDFVALHGKDKAVKIIEKLKEAVESGKLNYHYKYCKSE